MRARSRHGKSCFRITQSGELWVNKGVVCSCLFKELKICWIVLAPSIWHLMRGRGRPMSFWAADLLSLGLPSVLLEHLQVFHKWALLLASAPSADEMLSVCLLRMGFRDLAIRVGSMKLGFTTGSIKHYQGFRPKGCQDKFKINYALRFGNIIHPEVSD